jgi:DNA-3-methyladenine glycosylase II
VTSRPERLDTAALRRATRHLTQADPVLAGIVAEVGRCRLQIHRGGSSFAYLARAILSQQISGAAARSIAGRMRERFGVPLRPGSILAASDEELRALGLSRQKAAYLRDLAAQTGSLAQACSRGGRGTGDERGPAQTNQLTESRCFN